MIIAQMCLRLATIKGHTQTCSFVLLGGLWGLRKPVGVWSPWFSSCRATLLLGTELMSLCVVECWSPPLQWLFGVAGYRTCQERHIRRSRASQTCSMADLSGEDSGHARTGIFSFQELCTDPFSVGPGIIMLQHEVTLDVWHNEPQDLVTESALKMFPSITSTCHSNPTATMDHLIHNICIRKLPRHTQCVPSALNRVNQD